MIAIYKVALRSEVITQNLIFNSIKDIFFSSGVYRVLEPQSSYGYICLSTSTHLIEHSVPLAHQTHYHIAKLVPLFLSFLLSFIILSFISPLHDYY